MSTVHNVDIAKAIELHKQGLAPALIAERFKIPAPQLTRKMRDAGYRIKPPQGLLADNLAELIAEGATLRRAARMLGIEPFRARRCWLKVCERLGEHFEEEF